MLVLLGLFSERDKSPMPLTWRRFIGVLLAFALGNALLAAWHNEGWSRIESYLHFLLAIPIVWAVIKYKPSPLIWFLGFSVQALMLVGAVGGLLTSILSGTRGGWIALPLVFWIVWRALKPALSRVQTRVLLVTCFVLTAATIAIPHFGVQQRFNDIKHELQLLASGDTSGESVVPRLYMWQMGGELILQRPLLGWGQASFDAERSRQIAAHETSLRIETSHLHSDMIDTAVKHGVLGAGLLLALFGAGLLLFQSGLKAANHRLRALATAGFIISVLFIDFGLSQTMFYRNSGRVVFVSWLAITYGLYWNELQRHKNAMLNE